MSKKLSKRLKVAQKLVSKSSYNIDEAVKLLSEYRKNCAAKFDETLEATFKLGIDPKQSDQMIRGSVSLPYGSGKTSKIAAFVNAEKMKEAKDAGADIIGGEDLIEEVKKGKIDFTICVATPDMMPKMASLGKILGPKGLMPNPKLGTVTFEIADAIKSIKAGQAEYKTEKAGLVHTIVGKLSFSEEAIKGNIRAVYEALMEAKPATMNKKSVYMKKICISPSQGPALNIDLVSLADASGK